MSKKPSTGSPWIRYEAKSGVATLTIDQPTKMNAMTFDMWSSVPELIARAEADSSVRVIAVTGAGDQAFSAGADISEFAKIRTGADAAAIYNEAVAAADDALAHAGKPTVAVIAGNCFGGGMGIAMCCDLRIVASHGRFRIPAARLGIGYSYANIDLMVRKLGMGPVTDLLFSARIVDAAEALRLGIVNQLFDRDSFRDDAKAYLAGIAINAPLTLRAIKRALVELVKTEDERDVGAVDALVKACFESADYREGQAAFREKRDPVFNGT